MSLIKSSLFTLLTQFFIFFIGIGTSIIVVRTIGAEGNGVISLINNYFLILISIFSFSLHSSIVYYINQKKGSTKFFNTLITYTIVISIIIIFFNIIIFKEMILTNILKGVPNELFLLGNFLVLLLLFERSLFGYVRAINDVKIYNLNQIGRKIFYLCFLLIIFFIDFNNKVFWILVASILSGIVFNLIIFLKYSKVIKFFYFNFNCFKLLFKYGIKEHIGVLVQKLNLRFDVIIIGMFLNTKEVGYYAIGVLFSEMLWYVTDSIGVFLFPIISRKKDDQDLILYVSKINRINVFLTIIILFTLIILGYFLIPFFYGEDFVKSLIPFVILCFSSAILTISKILTKYFAGIGTPLLSSYCTIVGFIINIILLFLLVPKYGIIGAAIASLFAYTAISLTAYIFFKRLINKREVKSESVIFIKKSDLIFLVKEVKLLIKKDETGK